MYVGCVGGDPSRMAYMPVLLPLRCSDAAQVCGYNGPIFMTYPTRAIAPVMLEDYHKVMTERQGDRQWFTRQHIQDCMRKVLVVDLDQTV